MDTSRASEPAPGGGGRRPSGSGRNLPLAIASGVTLAIVFLLTLFLSHLAFLTFVAVLVVIALLELDVAFRGRGLRPATPVAVAAGLVLFYGSYTNGPSAQSLGLVLVVLGALAWALLDPGAPADGEEVDAQRPGRVAANVGATCLMTLWVPFLASFIGLLIVRTEGAWYLMAAIALTVTNDIGAFAFGSRYGRRRLAPRISPAKTVEGLVGGLVTTVVIAAAVTSQMPGFDLVLALVLAVVMVIAGTLGDLAESLVKRDLGVKDLGRIMPGHGGIMDRVDAIVFALPAAHLTLVAFGL